MNRDGAVTEGVIATLAELVALRGKVHARRVRTARTIAALPGGHIPGRLSRGMEFAESRPYRAGDDVRSIDWRQTARRGAPYTKLFHEEHEQPVQLLVDLGASMRFGTRVAFKSVVAARAAALLAWQAAANGDRVGGVVCGGLVCGHRELRPQGRQHGALALLHALADVAASPADTAPALTASLPALARMARPGGMAILISDFHGLDERLARSIGALAFRNEVALVLVHDSFESAPPAGLFRLSDGRRSMTLDLRSDAGRAAHTAPFAARRAALERLARHPRVRLLPLSTSDDPGCVLRLLSASPAAP